MQYKILGSLKKNNLMIFNKTLNKHYKVDLSIQNCQTKLPNNASLFQQIYDKFKKGQFKIFSKNDTNKIIILIIIKTTHNIFARYEFTECFPCLMTVSKNSEINELKQIINVLLQKNDLLEKKLKTLTDKTTNDINYVKDVVHKMPTLHYCNHI